MDRAYLSLDLDYFNLRIDQIKPLFNYLKLLGVPVKIVDEHHYLAKDAQKYEYDTLINLDEHSDLYPVKERMGYINCGNWVNFMPGFAKEYIWVRPTPSEMSRCDNLECPFSGIPNGFDRISTNYKSFRTTVRKYQIVAVGVALSLSDGYTNREVFDSIFEEPSILSWLDEKRLGIVDYMRDHELLIDWLD
jgi:hypothetical protein